MDDADLTYFAALIAGSAERGWTAWWDEHGLRLKNSLPKADFHRLAYKKVEEAHRLLAQAGREVPWGPAADRAAAAAILPPDQLDDAGWPDPEARRAQLDGIAGLLLDGQADEAAARLDARLQAALKGAWNERVHAVSDLLFLAHVAERLGEAPVAAGYRAAVARLDPDDEALGDLIREARAQS